MAGTLTKLTNNRYRLRYKDSTKNIRAKSDRAAESELAAFIKDIDEGDFSSSMANSRVTFAKFVEKFISNYAETELQKKTVFRYKEMLNNRILPALGDMKLSKIRPLDIIEFLNTLRKKHKYTYTNKDGTKEQKPCERLSEQTIKHHYRLLSVIFNKAIQWDILKGENVMRKVDTPKVEEQEQRFFTEEETIRVLDLFSKQDLKYYVAVSIAISTGCRLGECMGLKWKDINIENSEISFKQTSQYLPGEGVFEKIPKTKKSKRSVYVNTSLIDLIEHYKENQQEKGFLCQDDNPLFVQYDGKPMHTYTLSQLFPDVIKAYNKEVLENSELTRDEKKKLILPVNNFHSLRHTSVVFLISKGMDITTIAHRHGHSRPSTTTDIYSHFIEKIDKQAAKLIERSYGKKGNSEKNKGVK